MTQDVRIVAFRGTGFSPDHYLEPHSLFAAQPGLIKAGCPLGVVGISVDGGQTMYGFQPTPEAVAAFPSFEALLEHLQRTLPVAGSVYNDTAIFWQAYHLVPYGARTQVWQQVMPVSPAELARISAALQTAVAAGSARGALYRYPDWTGTPMPAGVDNCATWPRTLGIEIPEQTGRLKLLIAWLEEHGQPWP